MIQIWNSLKMKKPWVEISRAPIELSPDSSSKILGQSRKIPSEIFAILCQLAKGPSVQAIEIIRHVDASFDRKKSRWDYQNRT